MEQANNTDNHGGDNSNRSRRRVLLVLIALFVVIGGAWLAWWWLVLSERESTNDAYVAGNLIAVSAQVGGTVVSVAADDTQRVEAGQELIALESTEARLQLQKAAAALALALRNARQQSATAGQFDALVQQRGVELEWAEAQLGRRQPLLVSQAVSSEEVRQAQAGVDMARAALLVARQQAAAAHALTSQRPPEEQPAVIEARTQYEQAWIAVHRHRVLAPSSGYVARRTVQAGQRVQPGEPLLTIVPLESVWVDANFKEPQLRALRIGQKVRLTADVYGSDVTFTGQIAGVAAGTGSAFALLPPQNATGNWVKVVQRIPVRIALDPAPLAKFPLRIGLSMSVQVNTADRSGALLPTAASRAEIAGTRMYEADATAAATAAAAVMRGATPTPP